MEKVLLLYPLLRESGIGWHSALQVANRVALAGLLPCSHRQWGGQDGDVRGGRQHRAEHQDQQGFAFEFSFYLDFKLCLGVHSLVDGAQPEGDGLGGCLPLYPTHCKAVKGEDLPQNLQN